LYKIFPLHFPQFFPADFFAPKPPKTPENPPQFLLYLRDFLPLAFLLFRRLLA